MPIGLVLAVQLFPVGQVPALVWVPARDVREVLHLQDGGADDMVLTVPPELARNENDPAPSRLDDAPRLAKRDVRRLCVFNTVPHDHPVEGVVWVWKLVYISYVYKLLTFSLFRLIGDAACLDMPVSHDLYEVTLAASKVDHGLALLLKHPR